MSSQSKHFFLQGVRDDAYYNVLMYQILSWLKANYTEGNFNYMWTHDGTLNHTDKKVQKFSSELYWFLVINFVVKSGTVFWGHIDTIIKNNRLNN